MKCCDGVKPALHLQVRAKARRRCPSGDLSGSRVVPEGSGGLAVFHCSAQTAGCKDCEGEGGCWLCPALPLGPVGLLCFC